MKIEKRHIPNILSILRLMLIPVFVAVFFSDIPLSSLWALIVFIIAGVTDVIDGYLARRNNWISDAGKILDPLADKLMQLTAFVCLAIRQPLLIWLAVLIGCKELAMIIGSSVILKKKKIVVVSRWYGKMATAFLTFSVGLMLLFYQNNTLVIVMSVLSAAVMIFALLMYYFRDYRGYRKQ